MKFTFLKKYDFEFEYLKLLVPSNGSLHRQVQLHPVENEEHYYELLESNFAGLPVYFDRFEPTFDASKLPPRASSRFVELLSSNTLYQFSQSSAAVYRQCLDLRGLEFRSVDLTEERFVLLPARKPTAFDGFEGMRTGFLRNRDWVKCVVCLVKLRISMDAFLNRLMDLDFVKKYKVLELFVDNSQFDEHIEAFCDAVFHPGVEYVYTTVHLKFRYLNRISLESLSKFLDYCTNVKLLYLKFDCSSSSVLLSDNLKFSKFTSLIEEWALKTTRLERFYMEYQGHRFILDGTRLKRCVKFLSKWCLSEHVNVGEHPLMTYSTARHSPDSVAAKLVSSQIRGMDHDVFDQCYTHIHQEDVVDYLTEYVLEKKEPCENDEAIPLN